MRWTLFAPRVVLISLCVLLAGCPPNVSVPTVVGLTQSAASSVITGAGLIVGATTQDYSDLVPAGNIISQDPPAGTSVASNSAVALVVSRGPQFVTVPRVLFQSQAAASGMITAAGLTVGSETMTYNDYIEPGNVVDQNPAPGETVLTGSPVDVNISIGEGLNPAIELISVPEGTFPMGRTAFGDDVLGAILEDPQHEVTLSAYQIGKYDVTVWEFCNVMNWAKEQGYLKNVNGGAWAGEEVVYAGGDVQFIFTFGTPGSRIKYDNNLFLPVVASGYPAGTEYLMDRHPVTGESWFGAVAFCNWLSELEGLTPCYDMNMGGWPLTVAPPNPGGYRLPTEAEWERAAAWDGEKHWIYGFTSDTLIDFRTANYGNHEFLGLETTPVGWFDGVHVDPRNGVETLNSVSPIGCYDMCANVNQWCGDWGADYTDAPQTNPTGPVAEIGGKMTRGGNLTDVPVQCRSASRFAMVPNSTGAGFRVARS